MRIISAVIAATFFAVSSAGAFAAAPAPAQGLKSPSAVEFVKSGKKKAKAAKKAKKGKKGKIGAGKCGVGKYWKKGKCLSASDKK
jgi:hypothetical protein